MSKKPTLEPGSPCHVKVNGEITPAVYDGWSDKYSLPVVLVGGRKMYRKLVEAADAEKKVKTLSLAERLPQPEEIPSSRPSLLSANCVKLRPMTRLRVGDKVDYYGAVGTIVRVSDCSADVSLPRQPREITTRDGETRTVLGAAQVIRISPNSELPILNRP